MYHRSSVANGGLNAAGSAAKSAPELVESEIGQAGDFGLIRRGDRVADGSKQNGLLVGPFRVMAAI